jgi:hypothetical protein
MRLNKHAIKLACLLSFVILILAWNFYQRPSRPRDHGATFKPDTTFHDKGSNATSITSFNADSKRLVVASLSGDDTTWMSKRLPDWSVSRYIVDDHNAELTVPLNKGRESMVYLT